VGVSAGLDVFLGSIGVIGKNVVKKFTDIRRAAAGFTEATEDVIKNLPEKKVAQEYVNVAKEGVKDVRKPKVLGVAARRVDEAGEIIKKNISEAGENVGALRKQVAKQPIKNADQVTTKFKEQVAERFGLNISKKGNKVTVEPIKGRAREVSPADQKRITKIFSNLLELEKNPHLSGLLIL